MVTMFYLNTKPHFNGLLDVLFRHSDANDFAMHNKLRHHSNYETIFCIIVTVRYRGARSTSCLPTNPVVFGELLHANVSQRPNKTVCCRSGLVEGIHDAQHPCNPWTPWESSFFRLKTTWFSRSWHIRCTPFSCLMSGLRVILINPRLFSSIDSFDEFWVRFGLENLVFCDVNAVSFFLVAI